MKKLFMALMLCLVSIITVNAETVYGVTLGLLILDRQTGEWVPMDNGEDINVTLTDNAFYIASANPQRFSLYNISDIHMNSSNHLQYTADAYDSNGVRCGIRFVYRDDIIKGYDVYQIYVHYADIDYAYDIVIRR